MVDLGKNAFMLTTAIAARSQHEYECKCKDKCDLSHCPFSVYGDLPLDSLCAVWTYTDNSDRCFQFLLQESDIV